MTVFKRGLKSLSQASKNGEKCPDHLSPGDEIPDPADPVKSLFPNGLPLPIPVPAPNYVLAPAY